MGKKVKIRQWNLIIRMEESIDVLRQMNIHETRPEMLRLLTECLEGMCALQAEAERLCSVNKSTLPLFDQCCEALQATIDDVTDANFISVKQILEQLKINYQNEISKKKEIVFMPYKAAMWDALESIWQAACDDQDCDVYVVPIPYYDKTSDGTGGEYHYEGDLFPSNVTITHYAEYLLEERLPDAIYIHNPYDWMNNLTTVDPQFYSEELKKYTECLIYVPYYSTTGGMGEGQAHCPAYYNADYIVIQAEGYRGFFDEKLPDEKFLPLGSPKFDKVIRMCNQPPEAPKEWLDKMEAKKVFFYNTSISGMLADPENFFLKMEYVFECFRANKEVCLLWRPHPLLENCIATHLPQYQEKYNYLKNKFIQEELGVLDTSPDITSTIALSDVYIGDDGTSVTSLFGVAGKPIFILNNKIHNIQEPDDWRAKVIRGYGSREDDWKMSEGNCLYYSENSDYHYKFVQRISQYMGGNYYPNAMRFGDKVYLLPANAQDIIVWEKTGIRRIPLERKTERAGVFSHAFTDGNRVYLIPRNYPSIVCFHVEKEEVEYISGYDRFHLQTVDGMQKMGGCSQWKDYLLFASPIENQVLMWNKTTKQSRLIKLNLEHMRGVAVLVPYGDSVWILPYEGQAIARWEPLTGQIREYFHMPTGFDAGQKPYSSLAFYNSVVYVAPASANMYLQFDEADGVVTEWMPSIPTQLQEPKAAFGSAYKAQLIFREEHADKAMAKLMTMYDRRLYEVNLKNGSAKEIEIVYDPDEVVSHEAGYGRISEWMRYACREDAYCTLPGLLNDTLPGQPFDKSMQLRAYQEINANCGGTSGEEIHAEIMKRL